MHTQHIWKWAPYLSKFSPLTVAKSNQISHFDWFSSNLVAESNRTPPLFNVFIQLCSVKLMVFTTTHTKNFDLRHTKINSSLMSIYTFDSAGEIDPVSCLNKKYFHNRFYCWCCCFFLTKIENGIDSISSWHNMIARSPTWNYLTLIQFRVIHMTWKFQRWHLLRFLLFIIMLKWNAESKHLSQRKSGKEKKNRPI